MAEPGAGGSRRIAAVAAVAVLVLAIGGLVWPRSRPPVDAIPLLVFDPSGRADRAEQVYAPLAGVLARASGRTVSPRVLRHAGELLAAAAARPSFVLAPDGLALALGRDRFAPVVVGRGEVPRNLRPRGVLVWRRAAGDVPAPWRSRPQRTVLGDTLSLAAAGVFAFGPDPAGVPRALAAGPDPYDHGPALHAARLGAYDYALVRQWDADRFFADGLLDPAQWEVRTLTPPVPDIVLMASRDLPRGLRLEVGDALAAVGRRDQPDGDEARLAAGLDRLHLAGFNLLIDPDLDLVRGLLASGWPRERE